MDDKLLMVNYTHSLIEGLSAYLVTFSDCYKMQKFLNHIFAFLFNTEIKNILR